MLSTIQQRAAEMLMRLRPTLRALLPGLLHGFAGVAGRMIVRRLESTAEARPAAVALLEPAHDPQPGTVAIVNSDLSPGGAERQIITLIAAMARRAESVPVFFGLHLDDGVRQRFFAPALAEAGVAARRPMPLAAASAVLDDAYGAGAADKLALSLAWAPADVADMTVRMAGEFCRFKPAVVHGWQDAAAIAAGLAALATGVPRIVVSGRNRAPDRFSIYRPYMREAYRFLSRQGCVRLCNNSQAGAQDYARWLELDASCVSVVRNGVPADPSGFEGARARARAELGIADSATVVGGIIRFSEEKRPALWLDVVAIIAAKRADISFVLIGAGGLEPQIRMQANRLALAGRLTMPGLLDPSMRAVAAFDLLLLTSAEEGTPNVVLEAASAGVATVASRAGGTAEAMLPGVTGSVAPFPPGGSPDEAGWLADACLQWLDEAQKRESARHEGPRFVAEHFGIDRMVDETLALYRTGDT